MFLCIVFVTNCTNRKTAEKNALQDSTYPSASEYVANEIMRIQKEYEDSIEADLLDKRLIQLNDSIGKVLGDQKIPEDKKKEIVSSLRQEVKILTAKWDTVK